MPVKVRPIIESIEEINDNSWLIGDRIFLSRQRSPSSEFTWSDGKDSFYVISEAPYPLSPSRPLSATTHIQVVYDVGRVLVVWSIGDAFCKRKILDPDATREHVTLENLHKKPPLNFTIPDVHYYAEHDGRYSIVLSRWTGQTLTEAWPNMKEVIKQYILYSLLRRSLT